MKALGASIVVAILVAAAYLGYQALSASGSAGQAATATQTPTQTAKNAASFDQKVASLITQAKSGSNQPITIELTQDEVTAKVAEVLSAGSVAGQPVKDVAVRMEQGNAVVTGVTSLGGRDVPIEAEVKMGVNGGLLEVDVTSIKAAGLPVPDPVRQQILQMAESAMGGRDSSRLDVGIDLKQVRLVDGKIIVEGQTR
ncbi:MAG: hypothetical protein ACM3US_04325 [Sphingomonadaceae bacterium]